MTPHGRYCDTSSGATRTPFRPAPSLDARARRGLGGHLRRRLRTRHRIAGADRCPGDAGPGDECLVDAPDRCNGHGARHRRREPPHAPADDPRIERPSLAPDAQAQDRRLEARDGAGTRRCRAGLPAGARAHNRRAAGDPHHADHYGRRPARIRRRWRHDDGRCSRQWRRHWRFGLGWWRSRHRHNGDGHYARDRRHTDGNHAGHWHHTRHRDAPFGVRKHPERSLIGQAGPVRVRQRRPAAWIASAGRARPPGCARVSAPRSRVRRAWPARPTVQSWSS
ncbi:MAG: hypothetical protein QOG59_953 [Solirubrobacteraceae bacterium]|nr:hypothetical protein [Solirubrobacteraceae bacterium]